MQELPRTALLATWGTASLTGRCGVDDAARAVAAGVDATHQVAGLPGTISPLALPAALERLRTLGATGLRLVLPRPGDPSGLPGPAAFSVDAIAAGSAVVAVGCEVGILPAGRGAWRAYAVDPDRLARPTLREAELELTRTIADVAADLAAMDVARWDPAAGDVLQPQRPGLRLPADWPPAAQSLLTRAVHMHTVAELALGAEGAAVSAPEMTARRQALVRLRDAARHAVEVSCSPQAGMASIRQG